MADPSPPSRAAGSAGSAGSAVSAQRDWWWAVQVVVVVALALGTRVIRIETLPGEWYGDVSTVYEYVISLRQGDRPPGWYSLGIGPLHPMWSRPFLTLLGDDYLALKVAAATASLVGLVALFALARRLVHEPFALVATAIASVGCWWLVYSRLGDVQALTPTVTVLALYASFRCVSSPGSVGWAAIAGATAGLGVYLYGNTMVLPPLVAATLAIAAARGRQPVRTWSLTAAAFLIGSIVLVPFALDAAFEAEAVSEGHVADRLEIGWSTPGRVVEGYRTALVGYVGKGDQNVRGNPGASPHIDRLSAILAVAGAVWWLRPSRRARGLLVIGWFVVLHLPYALAADIDGPSVSRTTAAAPLAYLLVAGGTWAVGGAAGRALSRARAAARNTGVEGIRAGVAWSLVALISAVNLNAYFSLYEDRLPLGNAPVAGFIVQHARDLPEGSGVHLVGYGWLKGLPETKSVAYQVGDRPVVEHPPDDFGCDELDALARPAMVVWSPSSELPSPGVAACADRFDGAVVQTSASGLPLFRFVLLA